MFSTIPPGINSFLNPVSPMPKFTVVIASDSPIKIEAVKMAIAEIYQGQNNGFEFKPVKTVSHVSEQPFNEQTEVGAGNRLAHAMQLVPHADLYVAIENGIYQINHHYFDKAIIKLKTKDQDEKTFESIPVEFPAQYVEEAKRIGFDKTTVGECMFKAGKVRNAKDPHADLSDKISRRDILCNTIKDGIESLTLQKKLKTKI